MHNITWKSFLVLFFTYLFPESVIFKSANLRHCHLFMNHFNIYFL